MIGAEDDYIFSNIPKFRNFPVPVAGSLAPPTNFTLGVWVVGSGGGMEMRHPSSILVVCLAHLVVPSLSTVVPLVATHPGATFNFTLSALHDPHSTPREDGAASRLQIKLIIKNS